MRWLSILTESLPPVSLTCIILKINCELTALHHFIGETVYCTYLNVINKVKYKNKKEVCELIYIILHAWQTDSSSTNFFGEKQTRKFENVKTYQISLFFLVCKKANVYQTSYCFTFTSWSYNKLCLVLFPMKFCCINLQYFFLSAKEMV